jgi:hypothetical protein
MGFIFRAEQIAVTGENTVLTGHMISGSLNWHQWVEIQVGERGLIEGPAHSEERSISATHANGESERVRILAPGVATGKANLREVAPLASLESSPDNSIEKTTKTVFTARLRGVATGEDTGLTLFDPSLWEKVLALPLSVNRGKRIALILDGAAPSSDLAVPALAVGYDALGVLAILCVFSLNPETDQENVLYRGRSYFGVLRVLAIGTGRNALAVTKQEAAVPGIPAGTPKPYNYLMHGTTYHGLNYQSPQPLRRQATTYYHRKGPLGVVMERFNWFNFEYDRRTHTRKWTPEPDNTYHADARVIASAVGLGTNPFSQLVNLWSEPPGAVIGLGVGTMASYARPLQHLAFYEIDDAVKLFSYPGAGGKPYFNYVADASARGAGIETIMGDARISLSREENQHTGFSPRRDRYYHFMVVAAFSSDAVPVHLITEEAFRLYLDKMVEDGILLVNVSNRHLNVVAPVTDIAKKLGLAWRVGTDFGYDKSGAVGHFPSEYIILARHEKDLPAETPKDDYDRASLLWRTPPAAGNRVWTDDYSNLLAALRWGSPRAATERAPKGQ